jgi:hypothetical protein
MKIEKLFDDYDLDEYLEYTTDKSPAVYSIYNVIRKDGLKNMVHRGIYSTYLKLLNRKKVKLILHYL